MKNTKGFSIIELMVTVSIIGLLTAIAYPSYMSTVQKNNRTEATIEMMDIAQRLQRCYSTYGRFDDTNNKDQCAVYEQLEEGDKKIISRGSGYYEITLTNPGITTYTLTAKPVSNKRQADDKKCTEFSLDQTGKKLAKDSYGNLAEKCW